MHLVLLIHAHQPVGNFESVLEQVYRLAYRPFLEELRRHPSIRISFHSSGILLDWLERRFPEYLESLGELVERGQAEMVGGGFYEPVLSAIPDRDRVAQLDRMGDWLERRFGRRPRGAWLTERVWDPSLPRALAQAGIEHTLTDDYHFLSAGLDEHQLAGYYLTEWQGSVVKVIPGLKKLRYLLPFRMEPEVIAWLRQFAERHPGGLAAMGDDLEKFGAWPKTYDHVYRDGWLRRFFEAVEEASGWLTTTLAGDYVNSQPPLGRIYLPTAAYQEMMGWSLPAESSRRYEELLDRVRHLPDGEALERFVHGGLWHNFFHKYEEANHLHKRMLDVSRRYQDVPRARLRAAGKRRQYDHGYQRLLTAQCNDAYWHGVFGGLYAPHLRAAVYQALIEAEAIVDKLDPPRGARRMDLNLDGADEIILSNGSLGAVVTPADGGVVAEIAYRPRAFNAVNSLRRRPEAYHARLQEAGRGGGTESIHDRLVAKEAGLERFLVYDRYHRAAFRPLVFAAGRTLDDYRAGRLGESGELAAGPYRIASTSANGCVLESHAPGCDCSARNEISIDGAGLTAAWTLSRNGPTELEAGLELVLNLMAPDAHDRYFVLPGAADRPRLAWSGEFRGDCLALVDEWLDLRIDVRVSPEAAWWIAPIFTVSLSEEGFEKVYQGSAILPHWPVRGRELRASVRVEFRQSR